MKQRLINANKLRTDFLDLPNCYNGFSDTYDKATIIDVVDEQPTVEAIPIKWIKNYASHNSYWHFWEDDVLKMVAEWEKENETN
ncbi:MAG: hypothetical protein IKE94_08775 [Aeriscardovia sp.]|nr:hypothetical protein [Aeriscardovia sp.]